LRSILLVPIISDNCFWGLLGFDDQDVNRAWAAGDEAILNAMAGGIGGAISRQRAVDAVRASEEQFRSLIENGSDVIAILDGQGALPM
jgi:GAF domain-containing protein